MIDVVVISSDEEVDPEPNSSAASPAGGSGPADDALHKLIRHLRKSCGAKEEELTLVRAKFDQLGEERRSATDFVDNLTSLSERIFSSGKRTNCLLELLDFLIEGTPDVSSLQSPEREVATEADGSGDAGECYSGSVRDELPADAGPLGERVIRGRKRKYTGGGADNSCRIAALEDKLRRLDREIRKLDEEEVGMNDMESEYGAYLLQDRLKRQLLRTWKKLCELTGESTDVQLHRPHIRFNGTPHPKLNKVLVKFARRCVDFPGVDEFRRVLIKGCARYSIKLSDTEIRQYARLALSKIGDQLQRHRRKNFWDDHGSWVTDRILHGGEGGQIAPDPAEEDEELETKLHQNLELSKIKMEEIFNEYALLSQQVEAGSPTAPGAREEIEMDGADQLTESDGQEDGSAEMEDVELEVLAARCSEDSDDGVQSATSCDLLTDNGGSDCDTTGSLRIFESTVLSMDSESGEFLESSNGTKLEASKDICKGKDRCVADQEETVTSSSSVVFKEAQPRPKEIVEISEDDDDEL